MIIPESSKVYGSLDIWTSATITSSGIVSASDFRDYNFVGSRALVSDANKSIVESTVTSTQIGYLSTTSANIQTQLSNLSATTTNINSTLISASNWNSVHSSVNTTSANWNAASVSAHNHANKTTLDLINQSLNTSADVNFSSISATSTLLGPSVNVGSLGDTPWLKVADFIATDSGVSYKFETTLYGGDWNDQGIARYVYTSYGTRSTTSAFNIRRSDVLWDNPLS